MKILIADDDIPVRKMLAKMIGSCGYEVITAGDGDTTWDSIIREKPDIAILDWMMPGYDGISLCKKVRSEPNLPYVYIILLTSKNQNDEILAGFNAGADDYIIKPFDKDMLISRIAVGSRVANYEKQLHEKNEKLQRYSTEMKELAEERSRQLVHAERMATIGMLSAGIAHEINNPAAFIAGNIQILENFWKEVEPLMLPQYSSEHTLCEKYKFILDEMPKTIEGIRTGVKRISKIVNGLKSFCRKGKINLIKCDVNACIEQSLDLCRSVLKHHVTVDKKLMRSLPPVKADPQHIEQIMVNLFTNAADAIGEMDGTMTVETAVSENDVVIKVADTGPGFPVDKLDSVRQPFFTTKPPGSGTGLGLFIVRGIIENHKGQFKIENKPQGGALFTITLPIYSEGFEREIANTNSR